MNFDIFREEKGTEYIDGEVKSLFLESPAERKIKYLYNWVMILLTRAIDTLTIILRNPQSKMVSFIKEVVEFARIMLCGYDDRRNAI